MKKTIAAVLVLSALFFIISCASTPKQTETDVLPDEGVITEEPQPAVSDVPAVTEQTEQPENKDIHDFEEALPPEEKPLIPPLEEEISPEPVNSAVTEEQPEPDADPQSGGTADAGQEEENAGEQPTAGKPAEEAERLPEENGSPRTDAGEVSADTVIPAVESEEPGNTQNEEEQTIEISSDEESGEQEQTETENQQETAPVPSRSVTISRNQYLDVIYPGTGWIYLGQTDGGRDFIFFGRKLGEENTTFTLRSRKAGTYLLHFYKNDGLTGRYIDDYLEVTVEDKDAGTNEHIKAPSYADAVPPPAKITAETVKAAEEIKKAELEKQNTPAAADSSREAAPPTPEETAAANRNEDYDSSVKTIIQTADADPGTDSAAVNGGNSTLQPAVSETQIQPQQPEVPVAETADYSDISADDLLTRAQNQYESREYAEAVKTLDAFFERAVTRIDEGLYLQGQILESQSEIRNIKGAIDSYDLIVKNWPASRLWDNANKRSIFLKRFYINIR